MKVSKKVVTTPAGLTVEGACCASMESLITRGEVILGKDRNGDDRIRFANTTGATGKPYWIHYCPHCGTFAGSTKAPFTVGEDVVVSG